nr:type II toxin-antitoxin system YafQ family toxin [Clostridia bacterium]
MKKIRYSTRFKKDVKKYSNRPLLLKALYDFVKDYLEQGKDIPQKYRPHPLHGNYQGCWECHIHGDYLLIWFNENTQEICLERIGSHADLFK